MSKAIITFAEAAERARLRRQPLPLALTDWFWFAAICALPVWMPVLVGLAVVDVVGGLRR